MHELMVSFRRPDAFSIDLSRSPLGISTRSSSSKNRLISDWREPQDEDERLALAAVRTAMAEVRCRGCLELLQHGVRWRCTVCNREVVEYIAQRLATLTPDLWIQFHIGDQPASLHEHQARLLREACARKQS
jgi:hypothetical protein